MYMFRGRDSNVTFSAALALSFFLLVSSAAEALPDEGGYHGIEQKAPMPPRTVEASCSHHTMTIKWPDVGPGVSEYRIFRFENTAPDSTLKMIHVYPRTKYTPLKISYVDNTVVAGVTYTYFITSNDQFGSQSANSPMATARAQ